MQESIFLLFWTAPFGQNKKRAEKSPACSETWTLENGASYLLLSSISNEWKLSFTCDNYMKNVGGFQWESERCLMPRSPKRRELGQRGELQADGPRWTPGLCAGRWECTAAGSGPSQLGVKNTREINHQLCWHAFQESTRQYRAVVQYCTSWKQRLSTRIVQDHSSLRLKK